MPSSDSQRKHSNNATGIPARIPAARRVAVDILLRISSGSYSGTALDFALDGKCRLMNEPDRSLTTRLVYGVTERRITLDYIISFYSSKKINRLHPIVLELLRVGCYQLMYMDKIPPSAAVNETVKTAREMKQQHAAGFINAILRAIDRGRNTIFNNLNGVSVLTSCPQQLLDLWHDAYGETTAEALAYASLDAPPTVIRCNPLVISFDKFEALLSENDISFRKNPILSGCFEILQGFLLKKLANYGKNCYYHQDTASQYCCYALEAASGMRVADVCAAPGGKTITCAGIMRNGYILSADIHQDKCNALQKRVSEMCVSDGLEIDVTVHDAAVPWHEGLHGTFDRVLCDAPCSGLGVVRRRPEIKYKPVSGFVGLPAVQASILDASALLVRPGGFLQYSTCTLNPAENEKCAAEFLSRHPEFSPRILPAAMFSKSPDTRPASHITLFPHIHGTDGFFIAGFVRKFESS